jgi:hypothetical protein
MSCSTCHSSITNDICGCGCGSCKPFTTMSGCYHCPPPPPIEPCEYRQFEGVKIPVWHSLHPLIPMFKSCYGNLLMNGCGTDEDNEKDLACLLSQAEFTFSTCQFPGESYYRAMILWVAAMLEFREAVAEWRSTKAAMIALGTNFSSPKPKLEDGIYGVMLEQMKESYRSGVSFLCL